MRKHFGSRISSQDRSSYARSRQWDGNKFKNLVETKIEIKLRNCPDLLYKLLWDKKGRSPEHKLEILPFDKEAFLKPSEKAKFIWYGHSVILMRMDQINLLIDPMLSNNAAPMSPFPLARFSDDTISLIGEFPEIDLVLLTHDHYDHLDWQSINILRHKVKHFFVALGVKRHLVKWGIPSEDITEFDWWEKHHFKGIEITFTPSRHFSGRGLGDSGTSLWGGWAFKTPTENIWFSGDGGYGEHFKEIGDRLGPFDFAFMECGQYHKYWHQIHLYPEESVQASLDAKVLNRMPVHWAGFALSLHTWKDPVERFLKCCEEQGAQYIVPRLGQLVELQKPSETTNWWEELK